MRNNAPSHLGELDAMRKCAPPDIARLPGAKFLTRDVDAAAASLTSSRQAGPAPTGRRVAGGADNLHRSARRVDLGSFDGEHLRRSRPDPADTMGRDLASLAAVVAMIVVAPLVLGVL